MTDSGFLQPLAQHLAAERRVDPQALSAFADELTSLFQTVRASPERQQALNDLLSVFDDVVREMRLASDEITQLLAKA